MSFKKMANSRGERGHPCLTPEDGCTEAVLFQSNTIGLDLLVMNIHQHGTSLSRWTGYGQASGNCVNGPKAYVLEYTHKLVWSQ